MTSNVKYIYINAYIYLIINVRNDHVQDNNDPYLTHQASKTVKYTNEYNEIHK